MPYKTILVLGKKKQDIAGVKSDSGDAFYTKKEADIHRKFIENLPSWKKRANKQIKLKVVKF
jgi:hypothetical protein